MNTPASPPDQDSRDPMKPDPALYRSVLVLSVLALVVLSVFFWQSHRQSTSSASGGARPSPGDRPAGIPQSRFTDATKQAGIRFVHENGACGEKLLPETMGGGVAVLDYDNDNDADLLFVNGTRWPHCPAESSVPTPCALYRNDTPPGGELRFVDVTRGSGLDRSLQGMGAAVGDYDNDGWVDVYITAVGPNRLYRNQGDGSFADVTERASVGGAADAWSTSACWFDRDNDGDLDLFVCNYVQWSREVDLAVNYQLTGVGKAYGPPFDFPGSFPYLFRNDGDGRFTNITASSGLMITNRATGRPLAKSLGVAPVDIDEDGWMDLVVANDTVQNLVYHNRKDGTFAEIAATAGIAFDSFGGTRGAMGIDSARDGGANELSIAIGNFANEMTALYVSQPALLPGQAASRLQFSDQAIQQGIGSASQSALTFGVFFFDYDLDGWEDLLTVNGHIEPAIHQFDPKQTYRQSAQLFWHTHDQKRRFEPVTPREAGAGLFEPMVGRGSAYADLDGDGDLDLVLAQTGGPARLLRNDQDLGHGWVRLKLIGTHANRDAIGARVGLESNGRERWRHVVPTRGYLSQSELPVTFGLGPSETAGTVTILWPGGSIQTVKFAQPNQVIVVREAASK